MRIDRCVRTAALAVVFGAISTGGLAGCASEDPAPLQSSASDPASIAVTTTVAKPSPRKLFAISYHDGWRRLWEDHITWTRMVIIGIFDELPGTDDYAGRLLKNAEDMGNSLAPYYGQSAADGFAALVRDHLTIAADILVAAKAGDQALVGTLLEDWRANADALASQMYEMNPRNWPLEETRRMWHTHLDVTLAEATAHLSGDFPLEIDTWEMVHEGGLMMADLFSNGVIRQFRGAFIASGTVISCG